MNNYSGQGNAARVLRERLLKEKGMEENKHYTLKHVKKDPDNKKDNEWDVFALKIPTNEVVDKQFYLLTI